MKRPQSTRVRGLSHWSALHALLVAALVIGLSIAVTAAVPTRARADGGQPVSGAFNLGGGLAGSVDERTGQFSVSLPLVSVASRGDADVSFSLSWVQSRAGTGVDRLGWGEGWSLGSPFIDTTNGLTVYPASGGAYQVDTDGQFASGLENYTLQDLTFCTAGSGAAGCDPTGTPPAGCVTTTQLCARPPAVPDPVPYSYTINYDDGKIDYFDDNGNLVARTDRFGNRTDLQYQEAGQSPNGEQQWEPTAIVDAYGQVTSFSYGPSTMTVTSPKSSTGTTATTVVQFDDNGGLQSVTDPMGRVTSFQYESEGNYQYVTQVTSPSGAETQVTYTEYDYSDANASVTIFAATTLDVVGPDGKNLSPTRTFDIDPGDNNNGHNYTGNNGGYLSTTEDALFQSGDTSYTYQTAISTGATSTLSTYDSAHRLVEREITSHPGSSTPVVMQKQTLTYPDLVSIDQGAVPPANYTKPLTTSVTSRAVSGPNGITQMSGNGRTVTSSTTFDGHGRMTSSTDEAGVTRTTAYDPEFGLVTKVVTSIGTKTLRTVVSTLSADSKSIHTTTQSDLDGSGKLSARNTVTYTYDDYGRLASQTLGWAPGAAPPPDGDNGPASSTTTYTSTEDVAAATRTMTVTAAAGTKAATTTTTVIDLVTGQPVEFTDGAGHITTKRYDAVGRLVQESPPTGLTTKTSYAAARPVNGTPATSTVTGPDGHVTRTTYDALGRAVLMTDNVSSGAFVSSVTARTVSSVAYSPDGTTVTATDRTGRTTKTVSDAVGRPVIKVGPTGITTTTTYDDSANRTTTDTYGLGASTASQITGTAYDALNRVIASRTTYPTSSRTYLVDPAEQKTYDGLGRLTSLTASDLTAVPDFAGAGGVPVTTTVAPARTARVQSPSVIATDTTALNARPTRRTLSYAGSGQSAQAGTQVTLDAAGNVVATTDPLGRTDSFSYAGDGRPVTRTGADGTVSTNTFDPVTGQLSTVTAVATDGTKTSTSYTYVPVGKIGAGLVYSETNESGTITYGYDADRNRTSVTYPDGSTVSNDYADTGLLNTSTDVTGAVTTYHYYPDAAIKSATQVRGSTTLASVSYVYDGLGRVKTITRGNGLVTTNSFTPNNLLASEITVDHTGNQVEAHSYSYDNHHNLVRKTDSTAKPTRCIVICTAGPSTYGTYTTSYSYDSYDRLTGSTVYSGSSPTGTPTTALSYVLDVSGNITKTTRTTAQTSGARRSQSVQVTVDTINPAGQLTQRDTGSSTTSQTYDQDGRVQDSVSGSTTTYRPDGLPATVTAHGSTTTFSYWPDGTRRQASTKNASGNTTTVDFHYGVDGTLVNDTTTQSGGAGGSSGSATASYLLTNGREARTLQPDSTTAGKLKASGTPVTTGAGVGYFLRDRHSSVTALVDSSGAVTNTYAYSDYGAPALLDGRTGTLTGAAAGTSAGTANPLQYSGAAPKALYTDAQLGTLMTPARFYDPAQARFTARDTADVHNLYVGFAANPLTMADPTGQSALADTIIDAIYVVTFVIAGILTAGAAAAAVGAVMAATEVTAALVVPAVAEATAAAANLVGFGASAVRFADDVTPANKKWLSDDWRTDLGNIATVAGTVAGVAGGVSSAAGAAAHGAAAAADTATDSAATAAKRLALVEGEDDVPELESAGKMGLEFAFEDDAGNATDVPFAPRARLFEGPDAETPSNLVKSDLAATGESTQIGGKLPTSGTLDESPATTAESSTTTLNKVNGKVAAVQTAVGIEQAARKSVEDQDSQVLIPQHEQTSDAPSTGELPPASMWMTYTYGNRANDVPNDPGSFLNRNIGISIHRQPALI